MDYLTCPECNSDNLDCARDCSFDGLYFYGWMIWCVDCGHNWQGEGDAHEHPEIKPTPLDK